MNAVGLAGIVISSIGAICMIAYNIPALIKIHKTKDTSSISIMMFMILAFGAFTFVVSTICTMISTSQSNNASQLAIWSPIGVLIGNVFSSSCAVAIALIKWTNMRNAKKNGMTERQWCDKLFKEYQDKKAAKVAKPAQPTQPGNGTIA